MHQPGILDELPAASRYLWFRLRPDANPRRALTALAAISESDTLVGIGAETVDRIGVAIPGLREPPALEGKGVSIPSTPAGLWLWLRGDDRGELVHRSMALQDRLAPAFSVDACVDAFVHAGGRDLTGYVDGTENPTGAKAAATALVRGQGPGRDGASFVAVQLWQHDLRRFGSFSGATRDAIIGRRQSDNHEISRAPASAHVKRTAQETFDPAAFIVRRSMPWADATRAGLVFVAFGRSFDAFEAQLRRMVGLDDGVVDGLFRFTRPLTTAYFWCPPVVGRGRDRKLDLGALGG